MNRLSSTGLLSFLLLFGTFAAFGATPAIAPGVKLQVRMTERLSSDNAKAGDTFHGTLAQPVVVSGKTLFEKGTEVKGQVLQAHSSGRLNSPGQLQLVLTSISGGWFRSYPLTVQPLTITGKSHVRSNVAKIGGGTAAGAIIGGAAAGGKGAAIGAGVGAAGGTALAAATGKHEALVESEALLTWITIDPRPLTAPPSTSTRSEENYNDHANAYRDRDRDRYRDGDDDDDHYAAKRRRHHEDDDEDDDGDRRREHDRDDDRDNDHGFSDHDRGILQECLADNSSGLPPGLAKRDSLPPGLQKHLQRNGTLPPGLQKRVQPLPESCEVQLPRLPAQWERVILGGQIILLDGKQTIRDILEVAGRD